MWIVPIKDDIIETSDDNQFTVTGFTNYKTKGPAVYVSSTESEKAIPVYFFDIKKVNGIKVEYSNTSKVFNTLGYLKRKQHLPQKHDIITVISTDGEDETPTEIKVKVDSLKLHNKHLGLSRGLLIQDENDNNYSLTQITKIKRIAGDSFFDPSKFKKIYSEYTGIDGQKKS